MPLRGNFCSIFPYFKNLISNIFFKDTCLEKNPSHVPLF